MKCNSTTHGITKEVSKFWNDLPDYLNAINFWPRTNQIVPTEWKLKTAFIDDVPQQASGSGNCGAFACWFVAEIM